MLSSTVAAPVDSRQCAFPPAVPGEPFLSTSSPTLDFSHSDRCKGIPHCGFDLHFPDDEIREHPKCRSVKEGIRKMLSIRTTEYCAAVKRMRFFRHLQQRGWT